MVRYFSDVLGKSRIGFKVAPSFSSNRVSADQGDLNIFNDGSKLKLTVGPIIDIELTDNYYLSSGLLIVSKRAAIKVRSDEGSFIESHKLQYLQIPATLKLFTNEIGFDSKAYLQLGGLVELKVSHKTDNQASALIDKFRFFDTSLVFGVGLERDMGSNISAFAGIGYNRGLINAVTGDNSGENLSLKNDIVSIDFGVKF